MAGYLFGSDWEMKGGHGHVLFFFQITWLIL